MNMINSMLQTHTFSHQHHRNVTKAKELMENKFKVGEKVSRREGISWPGVVVARFTTTNNKTRYVVECTVPDVKGALHIYSPEQLIKKDNNGAIKHNN